MSNLAGRDSPVFAAVSVSKFDKERSELMYSSDSSYEVYFVLFDLIRQVFLAFYFIEILSGMVIQTNN